MKAIVYTSNTGHTAEYAKILGEKTGLPVYALSGAQKQLSSGTEIIYLGWLFANGIKGYKKAAKKYKISAICAVGLCDTGTALDDVRKINALSEEIPLFTMQGGMDKTKLRGINKFMINMLTKGIDSKKDRTEEEEENIRTMIKIAQEMQEEFGSENINLESLEETSRNFNNQRIAINPKNHEKSINSRKKLKDANEAAIRSAKGEEIKEEELSVGGKKVFEKLEGQRTGSKKKLVIKSGSVRTINGRLTNLDRKQIRLKEKTPLDLKKAYKEGSTIYDPARDIGDSEIGTLFDKAEEIHFKKSTVEKDNSDMQVEKIDVVKPEEKFIPQVEEQGVETSNRELENKLPKELTWADRAKQSLFKIGKKIGNVVKAITSKDSSKGVLERITNAIHLDSNSNYDNGSNSTTSTTDASTATEKIEEAHIDYLNMQFKVDINQALQNTKDAAEKAAQRTDSSTELAEDGERQ